MLHCCCKKLRGDDRGFKLFHRFTVAVTILEQVSVEVERHLDRGVAQHFLQLLEQSMLSCLASQRRPNCELAIPRER